jgi:uncharacterized membrane protein YdbT with pleckstrin-like domain
MRHFWKRGDELERKLRAERPAPRPELLQALQEEISRRPYRGSTRMRVVFACSITGAFVLALSAFGGLGYAASAAKHAAAQAEAVVTAVTNDNRAKDKQVNNDASLSSAQAQYGKKVTICHHTGSGKNVTITISVNALPAHEAHGDTIGACS